VKCTVPRVIGLKLGKAKARIRAKHCSVGRVLRSRSRRIGRVIGQSPRAGAIRRRGFPVKLVVGRR
jgi:beta-lactam-binding protein with PASTA domain